MSDIETKHEQANQVPTTPPQEENLIPPQYRGLPSEVVEEMWQNPVYVDAEKNKSEVERRNAALEQLKAQEVSREGTKQKLLTERYARLPKEQQTEFPKAQATAASLIAEHIKGTKKLDDRLSPEESFVLAKVESTWKEAQKQNPERPLTVGFAQQLDQEIYNNLVHKLSFDVMKASGEVKDQEAANAVREQLGIPDKEVSTPDLLTGVPQSETKNGSEVAQSETTEVAEGENKAALDKLQELLEDRASKSKNPQIYRDLFNKVKTENDKSKIAQMLVDEINVRKRKADYQLTSGYNEAWNLANTDNKVGHKAEKGWIYRGNLPTSEKKTVGRGSLNVNVDSNVINKLDELIARGVLDANYKFGEPDTGADASERHDAITIYFLQEPSQEAITELSKISQDHLRGNDLIGRKVAEGFYISEIGSVSDKHAQELLQNLSTADTDLAKTMKSFLTDQKGRVAMSEAQFYSSKEMLNLFGYDMSYDKDKGFDLSKLKI